MPFRSRWLAVALVLVCSGAAGNVRGQDSTLARIKKDGVIRWGADPSGGAPFVFNDPNNPTKIIGFEVEIAQELARHMGVRAELATNAWDSLIPSLNSRRVDIVINGLEVNEQRAEQVNFSVPYFKYVQQLTIRAADRERYHTLDDLKGKPISVLNATASVDVLKQNGWTDDLIIQFDDSLKPYDALKARRVEGALCESIIAKYYAGGDAELLNLP
ncbi:MAG: ABC transporter substrate-binding protein, partial [Gemmataceae bacterium]